MMMRRILASDVLEDLLLDPPPFFRQFCEQSLFFPPPFFFSVTILRFLDIGFARINIKIEGREEGSVCTTVDVRSLKKKKKNKGNKYINESCFSLSLSFSVLNKFEYYRKQWCCSMGDKLYERFKLIYSCWYTSVFMSITDMYRKMYSRLIVTKKKKKVIFNKRMMVPNLLSGCVWSPYLCVYSRRLLMDFRYKLGLNGQLPRKFHNVSVITSFLSISLFRVAFAEL